MLFVKRNTAALGDLLRRCLLPSLFLFGAFFAWTEVHATVQITPAYQAYTVAPGEKTTGSFSVTNVGTETLMVFPETREWFSTKEHKKYALNDWFIMKSTEVLLPPGETRNVLFELRAPRDAKGELMAMASMVIDDGQTAMINQRLSSAVYLTVKGTEKISARLAGLMIHPSTADFHGAVLIENTGNVHLRPEGIFQIRTDKNDPLANVVVQRSRPVQPTQTKDFGGRIAGFHLAPGRYIASVIFSDTELNAELINETKTFEITPDRKVKMDINQ